MDFGIQIRKIREEKQMLLRELAAAVEMDVAYLSKIERGNREARKEQVIAFARVLEQDESKLLMLWMADKIVNAIGDEQDGLKILKYAEEKAQNLKSMTESLFYNALTFDIPIEPITMYFSKEKHDRNRKLYSNKFPSNIEEIFPGITTDGTDTIYTSFYFPDDNYKALDIVLKDQNSDFLKDYYNFTIKRFFRKKGKVVKRNFVKDNQLWLRDRDYSNPTFARYDKFTFKFQFKELSDYGELIIAYDGKSKIIKEPVSELVKKVSAKNFSGIIHNATYHKYEYIRDEDDIDYTKSYAILNAELNSELGFEAEVFKPENKYLEFKEKIDFLCSKYVFKEDFKKEVPINNEDFLPVDSSSVGYVSDECNDLQFKNGVGRVPKFDFKKYKPYKSTPYKNIHLFFILHESFAEEAVKLESYLNKQHSWFKGLLDFTGILYHVEKGFSIVFKDLDNPMPEISNGIKNLDLDPEITYAAIYLSPFSKFEPNLAKREVYYQVKKELLQRRIISQVIDYKKLESKIDNFVYELTNISLALLAKLDGIPWQLTVQPKRELVIGVGAFKNVREDVQYVASAFSFQNNGKFNGFEYSAKSDTAQLAGAISDAIDKFVKVENNPDKVVIHFYKEMNDKELKPILKMMNMLKMECPLYIVNINKTKSEDLIAFDENWQGKLMPKSGTFIKIAKKEYKYLLFNNARYPGVEKYPHYEGYPFPVKLRITSPDKKAMNDTAMIRKLIEQVYQFSRLYWKSLRQQNVPVTIKYPEMVAEIAPHFGKDMPPYGKEKLWFL
ncbi:hypothetical protein BST97_05390 [Nonlabens spongiae]|uniref:Protein argonaute n=1 Tax=Nonlabens spongiae TaxID=331648 RepID=A0A1W6MIP2_9FLAO|nr:Piwi domain-containing protein [Nonlabens spongiae]ARN77463.1 hypothetical protein BST97_05390 [Nonlabens spongiae]